MNMSLAIDKIEKVVREHMDEQPYSIVCSDCGKDLAFDATIDSDLDLILKVNPCEECSPHTE